LCLHLAPWHRCGRAAAGFGESMRLPQLTFLALVALPICTVPIAFAGQSIADALDSNSGNGVFPLGVVLGVGGAAIAALLLARYWGGWHWLAALALGIGSGLVSVVVLLVALFLFCPDCGE
jgi:hypothetical protein